MSVLEAEVPRMRACAGQLMTGDNSGIIRIHREMPDRMLRCGTDAWRVRYVIEWTNCINFCGSDLCAAMYGSGDGTLVDFAAET